MVNIAALVAY